MIFETERLILREMTESDYADFCEIVRDKKTMYAYEHAFAADEARASFDKNLRRYREDGFGLWAVISKETGEFLGECGITYQDLGGRTVPEIGYLFKRKHWGRGYAAESAIGCKNYAFEVLEFTKICSTIRDTNLSSQRVAIRNGMLPREIFVKHYMGIDMPHIAFWANKL